MNQKVGPHQILCQYVILDFAASKIVMNNFPLFAGLLQSLWYLYYSSLNVLRKWMIQPSIA